MFLNYYYHHHYYNLS